jgi:hypothetical protein
MVFLELGPVDPTIQASMQELANASTQPYISIQAFFKMARIAKNLQLQLKRNGEPSRRGIFVSWPVVFPFFIHSAT